MKSKFNFIRIAVLLLFLSIFSYFHYFSGIKELPQGPHIWAQADRYALSLGFMENGFNFFLPRTHNLAPEYLPDKPVENRQGITRVDFPLHSYIPALVMKIFNSHGLGIFRLYTLLFGITGMILLYFIVYKLSQSDTWAAFTVVFALSMPAYTYYLSGTLPSVPSITFVLAAVWTYIKFYEEKKYFYFHFTVLFFLLAALPRLHFTTFLIAFALWRLLIYLKNRKIILKELISLFLAFSVIIFYFFYNAWLHKNYGSVYLSKPMPPDSVSDFFYVLKEIVKRNFWKIFPPFHALIYVFVIAVFFIRLKKEKAVFFNVFTFFSFLGMGFIFLIMSRQFIDHDYYFLDTFFPVILLMMILLSQAYKQRINSGIFFRFVLPLVLIPLLLVSGAWSVKEKYRLNNWDLQLIIKTNFSDAPSFLKNAGVSEYASVLVIDACSANYPLLLMKQKGYTIVYSEAEFDTLPRLLSYKPDYVVLQHYFLLNGVLKYYPQIMNKITKIAENDRIALFKLSDNNNIYNVPEFLAKNNYQINFFAKTAFENNEPSQCWSNTHLSDTGISFSGSHSGIFKDNIEFGATCVIPVKDIKVKEKQRILADVSIHSDNQIREVYLVVSVERGSENLFYFNEEIKMQATKSNLKFSKFIGTETELFSYKVFLT